MSRTDLPPTNKKAILCPDCGKWLTLQGYGGHRRFYHGEYQKDSKNRLWNRLVAVRMANKVSKSTFELFASYLADYSPSTMEEILGIRDFLDEIP